MFNDNKKNSSDSKQQPNGHGQQNRVGEGTKFVGDIHSQGDFRVDGIVEGNVFTTGKVVLGQKGVIKGSLNCTVADFEGTFIGTLDIKDTLSLRSTSVVEGDVKTKKLGVEQGASFNVSSCVMSEKETQKQSPKALSSTPSSPISTPKLSLKS